MVVRGYKRTKQSLFSEVTATIAKKQKCDDTSKPKDVTQAAQSNSDVMEHTNKDEDTCHNQDGKWKICCSKTTAMESIEDCDWAAARVQKSIVINFNM